jgi:hypothetical protein
MFPWGKNKIDEPELFYLVDKSTADNNYVHEKTQPCR